MRRRLYGAIGTGALILALGGCVQATRHSNTMVFGTNTSFGIKVGTEVNQTPSIQVGYNRQEAVIMPLVANTIEAGGPNGNKLGPCDLSGAEPQTSSSADEVARALPACLLVASDGDAVDSYSVLASFGAQFDAGGSRAEGGLAQYFATGLAAQALAENGGAAVVSVGTAATANASAQAAKVGVRNNQSYGQIQAQLIEKVGATSAANLKSAITGFEARIGSNYGLDQDCPDVSSCIRAIVNDDPYRDEVRKDANKVNAALDKWGQALSPAPSPPPAALPAPTPPAS